METKVKNNVTGFEYTYSKSEITNIINNTMVNIQKIITENDYRITGNFEQNIAESIDNRWKYLSINQLKKIQKYCYWIDKSPSLKRINTFFSLLSNLLGIDRIRVKVSYKEECIQIARKEWLKARDEAERRLNQYKLEKGDFYKNKMNFFIKK